MEVSGRAVDGRERALVCGTALALLAGSITLGLGYARGPTLEALGAASVALMGVGKLLPFWGAMGHSTFSPWELGLLVGALDTLVGLFVLYGSDALCRIPVLRRALDRVQSRAQRVLAARPALERSAIAAVVVFVMLPFTGTGPVVGTCLGTLLGLRRRAVIASVGAGSFLGGMLMALAAESGSAIGPSLHLAVPVLAAVIAALAVRWALRLHRRWRALVADNERLARLALCDELTGLGNRRAFDEHLAGALARAERYGEAVSLLIIDVDGMKRLNDTFGHRLGDRALQGIGAVLAACVRTADVAARFGGDEFAVILTSTTSEEAAHVAERIRSEIAALGVPGAHRLTASIGVASFARRGARADSAADLFARADSAMYLAKHGGRNLVRVGGDGAGFAS